MFAFKSILMVISFISCSETDKEDDGIDSSLDTSTVEDEPIIWTGPAITFSKDNFADQTDTANQDSITDLVVLTRGDRGALYNVVAESSHTPVSPSGTEWSYGTTDDISSLEFKALKIATDNQLKDLPGNPIVLHLIDEDIYLNVTFQSWTAGGSGGGFSYERSTPN